MRGRLGQALVLLLLALSLLISDCAFAAPKKKIKIGAVLPLTGDYAAFGADIRLGLEAFERQHLDDVSIVYEDGGTLVPARCVQIVQKVIEHDKVDAVAVISADDALPLAPIVSQRKIPLLIIWDSHSDIIGSSPYIFSSGFDTKSAGKQLAEFALSRGYRTAALVSDPSPYTELTAAAFQDAFVSGSAARIVLNERIASFDSDLRSLIPRILSLNTDVVYVNLATIGGISAFLRRLTEQGYKGAVLSGELLAGELIAGSPDIPMLDRVFVTWVQSPFLETLRKDFKARGVTPQVDASVSAVGFDAMNALYQAHQKAPANLREGLLKTLGEGKTLNRPFGVKSGIELQTSSAFAPPVSALAK